MVLCVNCYVVFHFLKFFFFFFQLCKFQIYSVKFGKRRCHSFGRVTNSACDLFIFWLFNCICLSLPFVLEVRGGVLLWI